MSLLRQFYGRAGLGKFAEVMKPRDLNRMQFPISESISGHPFHLIVEALDDAG